jgi:tight adherence protein C
MNAVSVISDYSHIWTGLAMAGSVFAVLTILVHTDRRVESRIRSLQTAENRRRATDRFVDGLIRRLAPRNTASTGALRARLMQGGFDSPVAVSVFTTLQVMSAAIGCMLGLWLARGLPPRVLDDLLGSLMGGCLGFLAPASLLRRRTRRRQLLLQRGLPDFLDLLVTCLDAGLSLEGSLQRITEELQAAHPVLGQEMVRVQREIELGATTDRALQSFADRSEIEVLRTLSSACGQARRFGSRLSQTLRSLSDGLRSQREQRAEEAAQVAAVKILLPTLILLFPIIFVVLAGPAAIQIVDQFSKAGVVHEK